MAHFPAWYLATELQAMFGAKPEEQRAYEERHPVLGAYYRAPRAEREAAAREHARRKAAERRTRKDS